MNVLGRTWSWVREQAAFLAVVLLALAAFVYLLIESGRWGRATGVLAVSMVLAGVLRGCLPGMRVGMLAVRGRIFDTVAYLVLGGVLLALDIRLHG